MVRAVRNSWAVRLAAAAVILAVLVQAAIGLPVMLGMASADAAPVCSTAHASGGGGTPLHGGHSHAHCLLCQASAAPALGPTIAVVPRPSEARWVVRHLAPGRLVLGPVPSGLSSRAPPGVV